MEPDRKRQRSRWRAPVVVAAVLIAATIGIDRIPLARARAIRVTGLAHLSRQQVLRMAGIEAGAHLGGFDAVEAARRLERDPWVMSSVVSVDLPSEVTVQIRERRPVAVTTWRGNQTLLGNDGTMLARSARASLLPKVVVGPGSDPPDRRQLRAVAAALGGFSDELLHDVAIVREHSDGTITMLLRTGTVVRYGPATDSRAKGLALSTVLRWTANHGVSARVVDVTVPTAPTTRPD